MVGPGPPVTLSVVLASCQSADLRAEAVHRLLPQCRQARAELIVARATPVGVVDGESAFDGCRLVSCRPGATIPEIRSAGLTAATGDWVLLTEDNCVARPNWIERLASGFGTEVDVVGGTMGNTHSGRLIDAAAGFAEYGFYGPFRPPTPLGGAPAIACANVAYRQRIAAAVAACSRAGGWDSEIHARLARGGARFGMVNDAVVDQNRHHRLGEFSRNRLAHGRDYAAARIPNSALALRVARVCTTPLLPPLLAWRVWRTAGRAEPAVFLRALPLTLAFFTAWAAGEAVGYLAGRRLA